MKRTRQMARNKKASLGKYVAPSMWVFCDGVLFAQKDSTSTGGIAFDVVIDQRRRRRPRYLFESCRRRPICKHSTMSPLNELR